jgi:hypothetical protein
MQRKVLEIEQDQMADLARIDNAIAQAELRITALKKRQLGPEELRKQISDIRDRTVLVVRDVRKNMAKRATAAKTMQELLTKSLRQRSRFAQNNVTDAKLRASFFATLEVTPTFALLGHFTEVMKAGDVARAESIHFEFQTRDDSHEYAVTSAVIMAKLALSDPANIAKRLANICRAAEMVDARITDLFRLDPIAALSDAHRGHTTMSAA